MCNENYDFVSGCMYTPIEGPFPNPVRSDDYLLLRFREKNTSEAQVLTFHALKALHKGGEAAWRIEKLFKDGNYYSKFSYCLARAKKIFEFYRKHKYLPAPNGEDQISLGQLLSYDSANVCPTLSSIHKLVLKLGKEA